MLALTVTARAGLVNVDGTPLVEVSVAGTSGNNGIADGYDLLNDAIPSTFNVNFLVLGNETASSAPIQIADVPFTLIGGSPYFAFVYDLQETNSNEDVSIDDVIISVTGVGEIWSSTDVLLLNYAGTLNLTLTPLGNGADMALFVPVSAFDGQSLTGADTLVFTSTQSLSNNGDDEWTLTDRGVVRPGCDGSNPSAPACSAPLPRFGLTDPITSDVGFSADVPEPGGFVLVLGGLVVLGLLRRRSAA
jgi:PEP-CTERM motif-containing protein